MGKKRKKQTSKAAARFSGLSEHRHEGTKLVPRLRTLPITLIDWDKDLLPEHLWVAALADKFGLERVHLPFADFMDALDTVWADMENPALGFISDFGLVPVDKRLKFLKEHKLLIREAFLDPIGRILSFYPDNPAKWLVDREFLDGGGSVDFAVELPKLRRIVRQLLPAKDKVVGHLRVLPSTRLAKHGKVHIADKFANVVDMLVRYPNDCNDDEKYHVQSFSRIMVNVCVTNRGTDQQWPKYFWRHNYDLSVCQPVVFPLYQGNPVTAEQGSKLVDLMDRNASRIKSYLNNLTRAVRCDLYSPEKDEILLGLMSRLIRLFVLMCSDPNLWARDTSGIMLRCLGDTAITFAYLAKIGKEEDFQRFKEYGEGQQKLLMLHLQDTYPGEKSLEGRSASDLGKELGNFFPELLQIELGNWSKKDSRRLAVDAGMERFYRLIFTPTSGDVHGTWLSLKSSNLCRCAEVLHRFHRLPFFAEPPMFAGTVMAAHQIVEECIVIAKNVLLYPPLQEPLERTAEEPPAASES